MINLGWSDWFNVGVVVNDGFINGFVRVDVKIIVVVVILMV